MELPHAAYFYTLAQIGIAFAGFATILMALRESRGRPMSKFDLWVAKSYIQSGLVTAVCAMLPRCCSVSAFPNSGPGRWQA